MTDRAIKILEKAVRDMDAGHLDWLTVAKNALDDLDALDKFPCRSVARPRFSEKSPRRLRGATREAKPLAGRNIPVKFVNYYNDGETH
jgi:hypothetical protein